MLSSTIMLEPDSKASRRRLTLTLIILGTLPCYCLGFLAYFLRPDPNAPAATPTNTLFVMPSETGTLSILTATGSLTPNILTETVSPTSTITNTPTSSLTPFLPATYTPTYTQTPSFTPTSTPTPTRTFTPTMTNTIFVSPTFTNTPSRTPTSIIQTPTSTPTASPTSFTD